MTNESEYELTRNYDLGNSRNIFLIKSVCVLVCVDKLVFFLYSCPKKTHSGTNHQMKRKRCLKCVITVHSHSSTASFSVVEPFLISQNTEADTKLFV